MRRPFEWVLSISLMVLVANHMLTDSDPIGMASVPAISVTAVPAVASDLEESPFAWIREDGSQVYLPAAGPSTGPRPATTEAVFTWTLPMATPGREIRSSH